MPFPTQRPQPQKAPPKPAPTRGVFACMPVTPDGLWWLDGMRKLPGTAMGAVVSKTKATHWAECQSAGWKIIVVRVEDV